MKIYDVRDLMIGLTDFPINGYSRLAVRALLLCLKLPTMRRQIFPNLLISRSDRSESWNEDGVGIQEWNTVDCDANIARA